METVNKLKQIAFSLGVIGFISSMLLFSLTYGLGIGWEITYKDNKFLPLGWNPIQEMAFNYFVISVCLLLFIVFLRMPDNVFLKVIGSIPLVLVILQCKILLMSELNTLPKWITEYSGWLNMILYMDFFFLILTVVLLILQFCLIWFNYHSRNCKNP